jgi:hypothetical protein
MRIFDDVADGVIDTSSPLVTNVMLVVEVVSVFTALTTCNTFPNPEAVPEFVSVAPDGTVNVSPESPNVKSVPVAGLSLFALTSLLML